MSTKISFSVLHVHTVTQTGTIRHSWLTALSLGCEQSHWNGMNVLVLICRRGESHCSALIFLCQPLRFDTMHTELLLSLVYCHWGSRRKTNTDILLSSRWPVNSMCRCTNTYVRGCLHMTSLPIFAWVMRGNVREKCPKVERKGKKKKELNLWLVVCVS